VPRKIKGPEVAAGNRYCRSSVAVACRVEPAAGAAFDELVEVLQQIYLNFRLVFLVDTVYRHGGMGTPFAFTARRESCPKRQTFFREQGTRPNPCGILSSRRSVWWSKQGGAYLPRSIVAPADETISSSGVRLSTATQQVAGVGGVTSRISRCGFASRKEWRRNSWFGIACDPQHSPPRPQADELSSHKSHFLEAVGCCVIGWAFGRLARFLPLNDGQHSLLTADPSGR
jgi:hypothetical protein